MIEIWKVIPWYSKYEASNLGRIKSNTRKGNGMILKQCMSKSGYKRVMIVSDAGVRKVIETHKLIARSFLFMSTAHQCVNHIDGIKLNNNINNLEYCTLSYNVTHAYRTGIKKKLVGSNNVKSKAVLNLETGIFYDTATEAAKAYNMVTSTLCRHLNKRFKNSTPMIYLK